MVQMVKKPELTVGLVETVCQRGLTASKGWMWTADKNQDKHELCAQRYGMPEAPTSLKYSGLLINYVVNICIKIYIGWNNMEKTEEKHVLSLWVIFTPIKGITASINQFIFLDTKGWNTHPALGFPT